MDINMLPTKGGKKAASTKRFTWALMRSFLLSMSAFLASVIYFLLVHSMSHFFTWQGIHAIMSPMQMMFIKVKVSI
ncbi:hypothetical protein C9426_14805 [Serratia sp. S1B]|nr:hypothetical protein C9426_14805 [Serratia sp. S1B]